MSSDDLSPAEEAIAEYLTAALENPDPEAFLVAVRDVAKARGISQVAATAGLGRESLSKAISGKEYPRFACLFGQRLRCRFSDRAVLCAFCSALPLTKHPAPFGIIILGKRLRP